MKEHQTQIPVLALLLICYMTLSEYVASLCLMKFRGWDVLEGYLPALHFSDILTLSSRAVRRQRKVMRVCSTLK